MKAIDELVKDIVVLLGQYFNANLDNDEIYELLENAVYCFIGDTEYDLIAWQEEQNGQKVTKEYVKNV